MEDRLKQHEHKPYHVGLVAVLVYILYLTLNPFAFSVHWFRQFTHWGFLDALWRTYQWKVYDLIANVILFLPVGFLLGRIKSVDSRRAVIRLACLGALFSLCIELAQLFLPRSTSIFDVLTNALGTGLGAWWAMRRPRATKDLRPLFRRATVLWSIVVVLAALAPVQMNHLNTWDDSYPLLLGNEATGDRPWQGRLAQATLYGRPLNRDIVEQLSTLPPVDGWTRQSLGAMVFAAPDALVALGLDSGRSPQMAAGAWVFHGDSSAALHSDAPPVDFNSAARRYRGFAVETWMRTASLDQDGPARIVSVSQDADFRNFTLGQSGRRLVFRVRTPLTGPNGSAVQLVTPPVLNPHRFQHVVAVFHSGAAQLYVDGRLAGSVHSYRHYFSEKILGFGGNGFARFAATFALLFPLGLAAVSLFVWCAPLIALLPAGIIAGYGPLILGASPDWIFIVQAAVALLLGAMAGWLLKHEKTRPDSSI